MVNRKIYKKKLKSTSVNEPLAMYGTNQIQVFNSFEEQEEYLRRKMAALSPEKLLNKLEEMRKFFMRECLLPNGNWPELEKKITIKKPKTKL